MKNGRPDTAGEHLRLHTWCGVLLARTAIVLDRA